jgi:formiminotetrahydrofolate cyclodeaminase
MDDREKLANLDKEVAVISQRLDTIQNNHLYHIEKDMAGIKKVMWSVGFLVFSNLLGWIFAITLKMF